MIIYKIKNKINGMLYIGQTIKSLEKRWTCHKSNNSGCRFLSNAIKKYGSENFEIKIVSRCSSVEEMNHREQYYIKLFNTLVPSGYNLDTGGKNSYPSILTINKRSESLKKYYENNIRKPISEETRAKISKMSKGRKRSKESIIKSSIALYIEVFQYDLEGNFIKKFNSISIAARDMGVSTSDIVKVCRNKRRLAGNFQWKYYHSLNIGKVPNKKIANRPKNIKGIKTALVDTYGNILKIYCSAIEASIENKCNHSSVCQVCNGKLKTTHGLIFKYI